MCVDSIHFARDAAEAARSLFLSLFFPSSVLLVFSSVSLCCRRQKKLLWMARNCLFTARMPPSHHFRIRIDDRNVVYCLRPSDRPANGSHQRRFPTMQITYGAIFGPNNVVVPLANSSGCCICQNDPVHLRLGQGEITYSCTHRLPKV